MRSLTCPRGLAGLLALALFGVWAAPALSEEPVAAGEPAPAEVTLAAAPDSAAVPPPPAPATPIGDEVKTSGVEPSAVGRTTPTEGEPPTAPSLTPPPPAASSLTGPAVSASSKAPAKARGKGKPGGKPAATAKSAPPAGNTASTPLDEGARIRRELDRTDPLLRSVRAKVIRSFNKRAREEYEVAATRQREAREAAGQNLFARAERLTLESRGLARQTAVHLGPPEDDPDYVSMSLGRTDDAISRAQEVLRDAGGVVERRRLAALEGRQKEARELFEEGGTRRAYTATHEVRDGVLTLLRDCHDLPVREETAEKALKRAGRAMEQAKGELGERMNAAATRLSREARAQMDKARAAFARKNYRDTLLHSKLVERNLELAVSAQRSITNRTG